MNYKLVQRFQSIGVYVVLTVGTIFWVYPLLFMVFGSLKPSEHINTQFFPTEITLEHYRLIFAGGTGFNRPFGTAILNSLLVSVVDTGAIVLTSAMAAYALARLEFPGRRSLYNVILFQMLFPGVLFLIPTFLLVKSLGMVGSQSGMIIRFLTSATGVFLYYQFFRTIPQDLIDAARVDGANELRIIWRVVLPLSISVTAFIVLFNFMARWSELLWDLIVSAGNSQAMTLSVLLGTFVGGAGYGDSEYLGAQLAGATILTLPIIIMFIIFRRYFREGIATTGLKG
jgi:multiple sugar transport system permease protein